MAPVEFAESIDLVFDVTTDTLDVLGKITGIKVKKEIQPLEETESALRSILPVFLGIQKQSYPRYSSKTIKGVPLFEYARKQISVDIPARTIEIYSLTLLGMSEVKNELFMHRLKEKIDAVKGDFRQNEICALWNTKSNELPETFQVAELIVECSSGTYVRVLAEKIASEIDRLGIADNINRIRIGEFTKEQVIV